MSITRRDFLIQATAASAAAALGRPRASDAAPGDGPARDGLEWTRGVCRYCGTGCGLFKGTKGGRLLAVRGDEENHNRGSLCLKGYLLPQILYGAGRLTDPLVRRRGRLEKASWDEALDLVARKFVESAEKHGGDSVAFYGSGQAFTEELYAANKLFRAGFRTNNVEGTAGLRFAAAAEGYVSTFGEDGPLGCYEDIDHADAFFIIGSNMAECHPILFQRLARRKGAAPATKVIVADPRRTPTARMADLHVALRPGADRAVLCAMAHVMVEENLVDRRFIADHVVFGGGEAGDRTWDDYVAFLGDCTPAAAEEASGAPAAAIVEAARLFAAPGRRTVSFWGAGLDMGARGAWANNLVHNLHLITGKIGLPGSTPFALAGQPNGCGGVRDAGGLPHLLPFSRLAGDAGHRAAVERLWGLAPGALPGRPGRRALDIFRGLARKEIRALYIMGANPGRSLPDARRFRAAMADPETFVVCADIYPTRTTGLADVVLPAAAWSEKEGVFASGERRYQLDAKVVDPPGAARPDLAILRDFAERSGHGGLLPFRSAEEAWSEIRGMARGTTCRLEGITRKRLYVKGDDPKVPEGRRGRICFYGRPDRRAVVWLRPHGGAGEEPDGDYPYRFVTGRVIGHWLTGTMTMRCRQLRRSRPDAELEMHPDDAARLGVRAGDEVRVTSRRGSVRLPVKVTGTSPAGTLFAAMHGTADIGDIFAADRPAGESGRGAFKTCAVKLEKG